MIEFLSWFIGRRPFVLLAVWLAEKTGNLNEAKEFRQYAERLKKK